MAGNGTFGHVQTLMCPKPGPVIPPGTPEMRAIDPVAEQAAKAKRERDANTLGIALLGPVFGGPAAAARVMGAPEAVVGKMGEFGLDMAGAVALRGAGGRGRVNEPLFGREVASAPKVPAKPAAAGGAAASGTNGVVINGKRLSRKTEYPHGNNKKTRDEVIRENTDKNGDVIDPNTGEVIPKDQVTMEHKKPVVEHWNEEGFNQSKQQRTDWYNNTDNLTVKSKSLNSSEGAKLGQTYRQDTGPNYSK